MGVSWSGELRINIPDSEVSMNIKGSLHPVSKSMARAKRVKTRTVCPKCASEVEKPKDVPKLEQTISCPECEEEYSWWGAGIKGVKSDGEVVAVFSNEEMKEISEERSVFVDLLFITTKEQIVNSHRIAHEGKVYYFAPKGKKEALEESTKYYQYFAEQLADRWGVCKLQLSATKETLVAFTVEFVEEIGKEALVFYQLAFQEDKKDLPKNLKEAEWQEIDDEEREFAEKLISKLTEIEPNWNEIKPEIAEEMRELALKKQETGKIEVEEIPKSEEEEKKKKGKKLLKTMAQS